MKNIFQHEHAEHVARVIVQRTQEVPTSLAHRNKLQLDIVDQVVKATDVEPIDALVIVSGIYRDRFPH